MDESRENYLAQLTSPEKTRPFSQYNDKYSTIFDYKNIEPEPGTADAWCRRIH